MDDLVLLKKCHEEKDAMDLATNYVYDIPMAMFASLDYVMMILGLSRILCYIFNIKLHYGHHIYQTLGNFIGTITHIKKIF